MDYTGLLPTIALVLGGLLLAGAAIAVILTLAGIMLSLIFLKTRQIIIPGVTLFILTMLEAPIRYLLWITGVEEDIVSRMIIEVRNRLYRDRYERTAYADRAIFLPQCLRSPNCPAPLTPEGIRCLSCGRCGIGKIKEEAEQAGTRVFICPGSSLIKRMVKKYRPKAILGVGCPMEVQEGSAKMASYGLPVQGVILERDGCVDTRVDCTQLLEMIKAHHVEKGRFNIEKDPESISRAQLISLMWSQDRPADIEVVEARKRFEKGGR